jgi:hypothetical protein
MTDPATPERLTLWLMIAVSITPQWFWHWARCREGYLFDIHRRCTIIRIHGLQQQPFEAIRSPGVLSVIELNDGSWEIIVFGSYSRVFFLDLGILLLNLGILVYRLRQAVPGCYFDSAYVPFQPLKEDIDYFGCPRAEVLAQIWFDQRLVKLQEAADTYLMTAATFYMSLKLYGMHPLHRALGKILNANFKDLCIYIVAFYVLFCLL